MQSSALNKIRVPAILLTCLILGGSYLSSCRKTGNLTDNSDAQISYYNASEYLQSELASNRGYCYILMDTPDTTSRSDGSALSIPYFNGEMYLNQFPNSYFYSRYNQPWISYMRISTGLHTIVLTDTGGTHALVYNRVNAVHNVPLSVYYADSLGHFRSWVVRDSTTIPDSSIAIRVLDLSPDAGNVFFTINGQYVGGVINEQSAGGFPDSLQFGKISGFIPWHNPVADTLVVRFYQTTDSTDVLTSGYLSATPGHSYNILLRGYLNPPTFSDPFSGKQLQYKVDLRTTITQNK